MKISLAVVGSNIIIIIYIIIKELISMKKPKPIQELSKEVLDKLEKMQK
jgi:hypothetical protein